MPLFRINGRVILFAHVPKTGGTSLRETLLRLGPTCLHRKHGPSYSSPPPQHWHSEIYTAVIPRGFYDWGFMVVRNPLSRMLSEYRVRAHECAVRQGASPTLGQWLDSTFERYRDDRNVYANHIRPQFEFYSEGLEVFRFEAGLQMVVDAVLRFTGLEGPALVRHANRSPRPAISASLRTIERIVDFYRDDFRLFGYASDLTALLRREQVAVVSDEAQESTFEPVPPPSTAA